MSEHLSIITGSHTIEAMCAICGDDILRPNKGLGRADLAAWKTRHQHLTTTPPTDAAEAAGGADRG